MQFIATLVVLILALTVPGHSAQPKAELDTLLARLDGYLADYELLLSSVVADEQFFQKISFGARRSSSQRLSSEVAFIRLPGGGAWLGFRDVKKVDDKALKATGPSVSEVLASGTDEHIKASAIADASAKYNLGMPRTINVPTAPLEIIHVSHRQAHTYELIGYERVRGTQTAVVGFVEKGRPTILREPTGANLVSSGRLWVEPQTGALWRIEWIYQSENRAADEPTPPRLRVDFSPHKTLGMMVPVAMEETFMVAPTPIVKGEGRATYKNFRRFGTGARIVPPPQ